MTPTLDAREGTTDAPTENPYAAWWGELPTAALDVVPLPVLVDAHRRARSDGASRDEARPIGFDAEDPRVVIG